MTTNAQVLPQSLFWTLEGGLALTLFLVLSATQAARRAHGHPVWRLVVVQGLLVALGMLVAGSQLGTITPSLLDASTLGTLALLGLLLATGLHLVVTSLASRLDPMLTVRPPTPPLTQQQRSRREDRRWRP